MGYILPNPDEMASSEDGYVVDPVQLSVCLGLGEWTHKNALACGAESLHILSSGYASKGKWVSLGNGPVCNATEISTFGQVEMKGTIHRTNLSMPRDANMVSKSLNPSDQLQYILTWQSVCPLVSSEVEVGKSMPKKRARGRQII